MMRRSLRWRLAWTLTLLSTLAVLIQAIALFVSTEENEEDLIDEVVNTALDEQVRNDGVSARPEGSALSKRLSLYRLPTGVAPPGMPEDVASLQPGNHEVMVGDVEYHVGIRQLDGQRLYLLYDTTEHEERLDQMFWNLVVGLIVIILFSLWLAYWLAGRMLYQLEKITRRLQKDDEGRLNEPDFDMEVALLAGALDDYRLRNRELLEREREFTSNVSHELRTPLTRIRTGAELFVDDSTLPARTRERAGRIIKAVDDMESRLRGLLFLAREPAPPELQRIDLAQCVEHCAAQFRPACDAAGIGLMVHIPSGTMVDADRALLHLLLENLVGNAVRHTKDGGIDITYVDGALEIADTGCGIPDEHLAKVFERYYRASDVPGGMGIGLSIVRRICDAHGWRCEVSSNAAKEGGHTGTRVRVALKQRKG